MPERDDFSELTKRALALRVGYHCSFTDCSQLTVGPSDESPTSHASIGVAAHICAAASGGPRHVATMTPDERSHIDNGIWLCATHARLIDRDVVRYTTDVLRQMKKDHEAAIVARVRESSASNAGASHEAWDLIALGPSVTCTGRYLEIKQAEWSVELTNFVSGDAHALVSFIDQFASLPEIDRYILKRAW